MSETHSPTRRWLGLAGWLAVTFLAAAIGSRFMPGPWYAALEKPSWTPPNAVFGPVWTTLYILMAVAAWLVWQRAGWRGASTALGLYLVQLAVNAAWSWLFFGRHDIALALLDIIVLWLLILATLVLFWRVHRTAGLLLVPYLLWVSYASTLNFGIWQLNP
jgi:tryptophan-rich sensory protein